MSFAIRNLSVLAYANGFTLWHYKSSKDTVSTICNNNYLKDASDMLSAGDMLMLSGSDGCATVSVALADVETVVLAALVTPVINNNKE